MYVVIVGGGKVGAHLSAMLVAGGHTVRVIEPREAEVHALQASLPAEAVIRGSGTDPEVLEAAGIGGADVVAAVTGKDETNLVAATLARFEFNAPRVIARVNHPKNTWMFTRDMGVDVAVDQADLMAHLIAEEMSLGDMMTLLKLRKGQYSLVEEKVHPEAPAVGRALSALAMPAECALTAVIRGGRLLIPRGDLVLQPADEVLAVVHASDAPALAALLGPPASGSSASPESG
jgi:trk system potassium uptake protein TrkA